MIPNPFLHSPPQMGASTSSTDPPVKKPASRKYFYTFPIPSTLADSNITQVATFFLVAPAGASVQSHYDDKVGAFKLGLGSTGKGSVLRLSLSSSISFPLLLLNRTTSLIS